MEEYLNLRFYFCFEDPILKFCENKHPNEY